MRLNRLLPWLVPMISATSAWAAEKGAGPMIRLSVQLVEASAAEVTRLLDVSGGDDAKLRSAAEVAIRERKAKVVDAAAVTALAGKKSEVSSAAERLCAVDVDFDGHGFLPPAAFEKSPAARPAAADEWFDLIGRPRLPAAWDSHQIGMSLAARPLFDASDGSVRVELALLRSEEAEPVVWMKHVDDWGDASERRPVFTELRCDTALKIAPGQFVLAAVLRPVPAAPPKTDSVVLLFARADILTLRHRTSKSRHRQLLFARADILTQ